MATRFGRLLEIHRELDEVFLLHAECLLQGEHGLGLAVLKGYRELLLLHMEHEERQLLPLYVTVGVAPRFPVVLYGGQHEKLRGMLDALVVRVAALEGRGRAVRRAVLGIFDQETTFKHLSEHHDAAERDGLFARLDLAVDAERTEALVSRCWDEWWARRGALQGPILEAQAL